MIGVGGMGKGEGERICSASGIDGPERAMGTAEGRATARSASVSSGDRWSASAKRRSVSCRGICHAVVSKLLTVRTLTPARSASSS